MGQKVAAKAAAAAAAGEEEKEDALIRMQSNMESELRRNTARVLLFPAL